MESRIVDLINECLEKDGGDKYRSILRVELPLIDDAYRAEGGRKFRKHLGASLIGRECERELWMHFRFVAGQALHEGRLIRLFNRGHLEEGRFVSLLKMTGCEIWNTWENGRQFNFSKFGGHFAGSLDGIIRGVPEFPTEPMLLECKTHNDRSFLKLQNSGMQTAKPEHYIQMQIYMNEFQLKYGLYMAVDKNDDALYAEIVEADAGLAQRYTEKARRIIFSKDVPARVRGASSSAWHTCKWCDFKGICWSRQPLQCHTPSCRTCAHIEAHDTGEWYCNLHRTNIPFEKQTEACLEYSVIPSLKNVGM